MTRVIITGGTGLIGEALARSLLADNKEVVLLSRDPKASRGDMPASIPIEKWDARTAEGWLHLCQGDYVIVNLAGTSIAGDGLPPARWTPQYKESILQSRLNAAAAVVDAVNKAPQKPRAVIQASAVGYYGDTGDRVSPETAPPGDDFVSSVCVAWEQAIQPVIDAGVRVAIIRTGIVLSMEGGAFPNLVLPFRFFAGGPIGSGKQYTPWIHIADQVRAIRFLAEKDDAAGVFNLSAPNPVTNAQLARVIGKVMGRPAFAPAPGPIFKVAFGEVSVILLEGQRAVPQNLLAHGFQFTYEQPEPAVRDLLKKK